MAEGLLPFDEALERLLALAETVPATDVPILQAGGLVLAGRHLSRLTQPPADASAMDGYALRFADLPGPLAIVGESAAGAPFAGSIRPGEACRIFTGAFVPAGADTVAVQEDAVVAGNALSFPEDGPPGTGAHIRRRGIDFAEGSEVGREGQRITPARLGLLASAGLAHVSAHRRPRVAILSTGTELVAPGEMPGPGQIVGANGLMLRQMLVEAGAEVDDLGILPDRLDAIASALRAATPFDLLLTIGGASVGDHDLIRPALLAAGAELAYWRVAIRPGKPFLAGRLGHAVVAGLPGNPASAFICARLFVVPLIRRLAGLAQPRDHVRLARTTRPLGANGKRRDHLRARLHDEEVTPIASQDSSLLSVLAEANAILIRPEHAPPAPAGTMVPVLDLTPGAPFPPGAA